MFRNDFFFMAQVKVSGIKKISTFVKNRGWKHAVRKARSYATLPFTAASECTLDGGSNLNIKVFVITIIWKKKKA